MTIVNPRQHPRTVCLLKFERYMIIWLKYVSIHVFNILYFKIVSTDY